MKNLTMIVSRIDKWFDFEDLEIDYSLLAIEVLKKLRNRQVVGIDYDPIQLTQKISDRTSFEGISAMDNALVILLSRGLVEFRIHSKKRKLFITLLGEQILSQYEKEAKESVY